MEELAGDILIVGLGSSGEAAATYLARAAHVEAPLSVTVVDSADDDRVEERAERLRAQGVTVLLGIEEFEGKFDRAIMSPGVPPHAPLYRAAAAHSAELISEIEFAYRRSRAPWLAVTGTNGKTTVTSLLGHLLTCGGVSAHVVGNIGTPAIEVADVAGPAEAIVAEVSSFQLALTHRFRPLVSVLLNVTPDHLDWHGDMARYVSDKGRIFANQGPDDTAVIDADDPGAAAFIDPVVRAGVQVVRVSRFGSSGAGAWLEPDGTLVAAGINGPVPLCSRGELRIVGDHNVSNALAAASAALAFGVEPGVVREGLVSFAPIEHRLEPVGTVEGVEYVNDSKATNPDAVVKALTAFPGRTVVLILGGRNKGNDFAMLARAVADTGARPVLFGEAAVEIARALEDVGVVPEHEADLAGAVARATRTARSAVDAVVLLSPACASFDQFSGYAERGATFKALVSRLAEEVD